MQRFSNSLARNAISTDCILGHAIHNQHGLNLYMYEIQLRWLLLHSSIDGISNVPNSWPWLVDVFRCWTKVSPFRNVAINFQRIRIWSKLDFQREKVFLFEAREIKLLSILVLLFTTWTEQCSTWNKTHRSFWLTFRSKSVCKNLRWARLKLTY